MFSPPAPFVEKSWLGVLNRWIMDTPWEVEEVDSSLMFSKTSLTDDRFLLSVNCSLTTPILSVVIYAHPSSGASLKNAKISFDQGEFYEELWSLKKLPSVVGHVGDNAREFLKQILAADLLTLEYSGGDKLSNKSKFFLYGLHDLQNDLETRCRWP